MAYILSMLSKMIFQLLERALDECGNDLDAAIKSLHELSLKYAEGNSETAEESNSNMGKGMRFLVGQVGYLRRSFLLHLMSLNFVL